MDSYLLVYDVETQARTQLPFGTSEEFDISGNGEVIVYHAYDSEGVAALTIYDRGSGNTTSVDVAEFGSIVDYSWPRISGDGQVVAFTLRLKGYDTWEPAIFLYDRAAEKIQRATTQPRTLSPSLSNDGRILAYERSPGEYGRNTEIQVLDRASGESALVSVNSDGEPANGWSFEPSISRDGRFVVFRSSATDLLAPSSIPPTNGGAEVYLHDRETGATSLLSTAADSGEPSGTVDWTTTWSKRSHAISNDGQFVVYESNADNIVPVEGPASAPDNNVYRHEAESGRTIRVSINSLGEPATGWRYPSISDDGRFITFVTDSTNLDPDDVDYDDAYLHDVRSGETRWASRR